MTAARTAPPIPGVLLVVGGQCRKVGKSALVVDIIKAFPNRNWIAAKITPYVEAGCPINGDACRCAAHEHTFTILDESDSSGKSDTSRFLAAGAERALWVQTKDQRLEDALPSLATELANAAYAIVESDSLVKFWKPSQYVMVLDPANPDFKISARESLPLADAFVFRSPFAPSDPSPAAIVSAQKPRFLQPLGSPLNQELQHFLSGSI
ncbi:MAG: hypothetical protein WB987_17155 [Candidatus Acidiferrales bacterium]